jgi:subtilisin family serine protease
MKKWLLILLCVLCIDGMQAQNVLSARSRLQLNSKNGIKKMQGAMPLTVDAFVEADAGLTTAQLQEMGVEVNSRVGSILTVRMPMDALPGLARKRGVRRISLAQPMTLCNDSARYLCRVDATHEGLSLPRSYTGKGVIVGMIDVGIDFNHINFIDSTGQSRVLGAYLPADTTGVSPVINGLMLPGSAYETPEAIAQLTSDCTTQSHGTHTTGTAAGGYRGNAFYGVAPEASLVLCAMPPSELTDVNIANSLNYIFHFADSVGMPCVVNLSISSHEGAHDGTSVLCRLMDEWSAPGRICVLAAGNDGSNPLCAKSQQLAAGDTVTALLTNSKQTPWVTGYVSLWSSNTEMHRMRFVLIDKATCEVMKSTPYYLYDEAMPDSVYHIDMSADFDGDYGDGYVNFAFERLHKFHTIMELETTGLPDNLFLALQLVPDGDCELIAWCSGMRMSRLKAGDPMWLQGTSNMSISDLATGAHTLSVGAYNSRAKAAVQSGNNATLTSGVVLYDIVQFSSYGPDANGVMRPDVMAPGKTLVSSYNRYNPNDLDNPRWVNSYVTIDGERYAYGSNLGTSMSAPVVTGAVALWLEANPQLTGDDVREVLRQTSYRDSYVMAGDPQRWGFGKLNVTAGLHYVITGALHGDVNRDEKVNVSDVTALINMILEILPTDEPVADVNADGKVNVSDVTALINIILGVLQ